MSDQLDSERSRKQFGVGLALLLPTLALFVLLSAIDQDKGIRTLLFGAVIGVTALHVLITWINYRYDQARIALQQKKSGQ